MTLASLTQLLAGARRDGYALGYFESWDLYSMEAAMEAAEETRSPAILGFGGAVTRGEWLDRWGVPAMSTLARCLAERSQVPTAVLFNEAQTLSQVRSALACGVNAVMLSTAHLPFAENVLATQEVVAAAHAAGAAVEAELGHLPDAIDPNGHAVLTDPGEAARFVDATGVDVLAVSIGNAHMVRSGETPVDVERLAALHAAVPRPLALHGGTGLPAAAVAEAIRHGVAKINVGTLIKRRFLSGIQSATPHDPMTVPDIHPYVGSRDALDVLGAGKREVKARIIEFMHIYDSVGRADVRPGPGSQP